MKITNISFNLSSDKNSNYWYKYTTTLFVQQRNSLFVDKFVSLIRSFVCDRFALMIKSSVIDLYH